jgi:hypothetical protein
LGEIDQSVARDVGEFVVIHEDPETRGATPKARARALRIARSAYHALGAWPDARRVSERLVDLDRARQPPPDPEARDDELLLVSYLLHLRQSDRARQRLAAHEARYAAAYPDDADYHRRLQLLHEELATLHPTEREITP